MSFSTNKVHKHKNNWLVLENPLKLLSELKFQTSKQISVSKCFCAVLMEGKSDFRGSHNINFIHSKDDTSS